MHLAELLAINGFGFLAIGKIDEGDLEMNKFLMIALVGMLVFAGCEEKRKLFVYTWADYIDPTLIEHFEKQNECKVVISTFDSNETMFAKLVAGSTGYDIIMPTEYVMPQLIHADLIDKLDMAQLTNVCKNFDAKFTSDWSLKYDVPYAFSCTGIIWKKDKVPSDLTFEDWNDLFDSRLNGHICIMNDIREVLGIALKMNGYSVNSTNEVELKKATELAKTWKNKCEKMDNEAYRTGIPAGEFYAAMAYNSDAIQLVVDEGDENIGYFVPTNGTTSSIDVFCIMKNAKNKDLAYKFIDMFYDIDCAVKNSEYNGAPMPVSNLFENLPADYKAIPMMKVSEELKAKCEDIKDVGENIRMYSVAWDEVKRGE